MIYIYIYLYLYTYPALELYNACSFYDVQAGSMNIAGSAASTSAPASGRFPSDREMWDGLFVTYELPYFEGDQHPLASHFRVLSG